MTELGYLQVERPKLDNGQYGPKHWIMLDPDSDSTTVDHSTMEPPHMVQSTDNKENYLIKKTNIQDIYSSHFELFWSHYPRKTGKGAAKKAFFKAVASTDVDLILEGVFRLAKDPNLPPQTFIPYPATWLNAESWHDEPYPERVKSPEELAEERKRKAESDRAAQKRATEALMAEMAESKKLAAREIPKCAEHGQNIASCLRCLNKKS